MEQSLVHWLTKAIEWHDRLMAIPAVRSWVEILRILVGLSGAFWLLTKALGFVAHVVHDNLDRSLADLFAVVYNLALAVLYASVLVYAAIAERGGKPDFLAFEAAGFVLVYLVLSATYREPSGHLSEYALPGFWGGLAAYIFLTVRTQYLSNPVTPKAYAIAALFMRSRLATLVTAFAVLGVAVRGLYRFRLYLLFKFPPSPRRKIKRANLETP